jgi:RNA polymerase sigma-70 factor, ECF subfamily
MNSGVCNIAISPDTKEMPDSLLVMSAKSGDSVAFVELCQRYSKILLRRIYRITKNWEDAEDVLQDAFMKAYVHLNSFEGRSSFSSWLTRIAINSALMNLRKRRTYCEISIDGTNDDSGIDDKWDLRDSAEDPEKCYARREREELLRGAVVRLRRDFRDVVELQQSQEYSTKELAQALGISVAAAKSRLLRARMALRAALVN